MFPKEYEPEVIQYIKSVKEREAQLLTEVTPRMVVGFMNMVKASARMNMRERVSKEDIERVKLIFEQAINLNLETIIPHKHEKRPLRNTPARGYK